MLIILASLLTCMLIIAGVIFIMSPGKSEPFKDKGGNPLPGSISEKIFINIIWCGAGYVYQKQRFC